MTVGRPTKRRVLQQYYGLTVSLLFYTILYYTPYKKLAVVRVSSRSFNSQIVQPNIRLMVTVLKFNQCIGPYGHSKWSDFTYAEREGIGGRGDGVRGDRDRSFIRIRLPFHTYEND